MDFNPIGLDWRKVTSVNIMAASNSFPTDNAADSNEATERLVSVTSSMTTNEPNATGVHGNDAMPTEDYEEASRPYDQRKADDPITLIDPTGTRWIFPFQACREWKATREILKKIFETLPWFIKKIDPSKESDESFLILKLIPEETRILTDHWEQMVQPGCQLRIQLEGDSKEVLQSPINDETKAVDEQPDKEVYSDISYMVQLYQLGYVYPDFLREKTYKESIFNQVKQPTEGSKSVLQEIRHVVLARNKRSVSLDDSYDRVESDDIVSEPYLRVMSSILLNALKAVIQFQNEIPDTKDDRFESRIDEAIGLENGIFVFPYTDLYCHKDELLAYRNKTTGPRGLHTDDYNKECDRHIDILIKYLYDQPRIRLRDAEEAWDRPVPVTTFNWIWLLLKPGSDVYVRERGELNAYVVGSITQPTNSDIPESGSGPRQYQVKLWNLDFDGRSLRRAAKTVSIPVFDGEREIGSLPVYPVRFHDAKSEEKSLRDGLIDRGKTFVKMLKQPSFREYTGRGEFHIGRNFNRSRVVVDHTTLPWFDLDRQFPDVHFPGRGGDRSLAMNIRIPECPCATCIEAQSEALYQRIAFDDYDDIDLDGSLSDHQYFLCWSHVYGYALQDRLWDLMNVRGFKEPRIERNIIDTLVMKPESNKSMIKAICETYAQKQSRDSLFFADLVHGKGEGQVILLHGPPGTGKTLTAESVAEYTERPLLNITAADLGHEPALLEQNLLRFLRNANRWDAIVLLDEADVYMERRSMNDMTRNSIVSIFLRALDYFQGILFLTTNRVGAFDEAFMSRIHVQIGYEPLDDAARQQIWSNTFNKLATNHTLTGHEIRYSDTAKEFVFESKKLKSLKWNGRQIRNAFQTAVVLASYEAKQQGQGVTTVTEDHLSKVVEMSSNFTNYMESALQASDEELAYRNRIRNDRFKLVPIDN